MDPFEIGPEYCVCFRVNCPPAIVTGTAKDLDLLRRRDRTLRTNMDTSLASPI